MLSVQRSVVAGIVVVLVILFIFSFSPFVIVRAGERGIVLTWGAFNGQVLEPGLHWRTPIAQKVVKMDVQTQKKEHETIAYSKDLQQVTVKLALNYNVEPKQAGLLYQNIGTNFESRIVAPSIEESVKQAVSKFTAEQLISLRGQVKDEIKAALTPRLAPSFIIATEFSITDSFSDQFEAAVEQKQVSEQQALKAKNDLERVKFEAQQKIETAKADAESIRIQAKALAENKELVKLKAVEKWNGILPQTMLPGGSVPFLGIQ